jgi:putative transcriptional regulator
VQNKVREERQKTGLTQQDLADRVLVSRQTIFAVETGKYMPSTVLALKIAKAFGRKVEELFVLDVDD